MENQNKLRRTLFLTATFALLAFAAACLFYGGNNFVIHSVGLLAIFASLALGRRSRTLPQSPEVRAMQSAWALKPWHWMVGLALVIAVVASYIWLQHDAVTGGKNAIPVYAFAGVVVLSAGWWGGLFARWKSQRGIQ